MELAKVFLESCGEGVDRWAARSPLIASQRLRPATRPWWSTAAAATMATRQKKLAIDKANKKPTNEPDDNLTDDSVPFGAHELTDEEIEDHDRGVEAGLAGKPNDDTKSAAWQRGWADAQE